MKTSVLLEEKWKVQKECAEKAHYNIFRYAELIDEIVKEVTRKFKHTIKKKNTELLRIWY